MSTQSTSLAIAIRGEPREGVRALVPAGMNARRHIGLDSCAFSGTVGQVRLWTNPTAYPGGGSADVEVLQP